MKKDNVNQEMNIDEVVNYIKNSSKKSIVYIAGDSKPNGKKIVYAVVVIIHNIDRFGIGHGCKVFRQVITRWPKRTIKAGMKKEKIALIIEKLRNEVSDVIPIAEAVVPHIGDRKYEIHIDVNEDENHTSNKIMKEVMGWIFSMFGVYPILKPHAIHASNAADHYTKAKNVPS